MAIENYAEDVDFTTDTSSIMFTTCDEMKSLKISTTPDLEAEKNEEIIVTLSVNLTHTMDGSTLDLTDEERARLRHPGVVNVTIMDDDGKYYKTCLTSVLP